MQLSRWPQRRCGHACSGAGYSNHSRAAGADSHARVPDLHQPEGLARPGSHDSGGCQQRRRFHGQCIVAIILPWLSVDTVTGVTPARIRVTATPPNAIPGTHTGTIRIALAGDDSVSQSIPVKLVVVDTPKLLFSPDSISLQAQAGSANQIPQELQVRGTGPLIGYSIEADGIPWLSLSPPGGHGGLEIDKTGATVAIVGKVYAAPDATALKPGIYHCSPHAALQLRRGPYDPLTLTVSSGSFRAPIGWTAMAGAPRSIWPTTTLSPAEFTIRFQTASGRSALVPISGAAPTEEIRGTIPGRASSRWQQPAGPGPGCKAGPRSRPPAG